MVSNDWQRTFLRKLEQAKKNWSGRLDKFLGDHVDQTFAHFEQFAAKSGIDVSAPKCEGSVRIFKFGLTENGYVIFRFGQRGIDRVEVRWELFLPGADKPKSDCNHLQIADADEHWITGQFQQGLDRLVSAFAELEPEKAPELVEA